MGLVGGQCSPNDSQGAGDTHWRVLLIPIRAGFQHIMVGNNTAGARTIVPQLCNNGHIWLSVNLGIYGVGPRDIVMNVRGDGMGGRNIVISVRNGYACLCLYREPGLEEVNQWRLDVGYRTHLERLSNFFKFQLPGGNPTFIVLRVEEARDYAPFA
jgi:hypothetical protein